MLLESAPAGTDVRAVGEAMAAEPQVVEVHDLHVWTVTSGFPALSAHVVVRSRAPVATSCCAADGADARRALRHPRTRRSRWSSAPTREELIQLERRSS